MFRDLKSYLKALTNDWLQVVFLALDILGVLLVFQVVDEKLDFLNKYGIWGANIKAILSEWSGFFMFSVSFIAANFRVYRALNKELAAFQDQAPKLYLSATTFGEAYISAFYAPSISPIHLLFNITIENDALWPAFIHEIAINPGKNEWPLPDKIWPTSKVLELKKNTKTHVSYFRNLFENSDSPFVTSAVNEIAPPEYERFSDEILMIAARKPEYKTVHIEFGCTLPKKDIEAGKLNYLVEQQSLTKVPFNLQVVYSFESNNGEVKGVYEQTLYIDCSSVIRVLIKKLELDDSLLGLPVWYSPEQELNKVRDDRVRKEISEGILVLKKNPNLLKENDS